MEQLAPNLSEESRAAAVSSIDDTLYGVMMVIDRVTGTLSNSTERVDLQVVARLLRHRQSDDAPEVLAHVDLAEGDGMCMGFHGWRDDDFGKLPVAKAR